MRSTSASQSDALHFSCVTFCRLVRHQPSIFNGLPYMHTSPPLFRNLRHPRVARKHTSERPAPSTSSTERHDARRFSCVMFCGSVRHELSSFNSLPHMHTSTPLFRNLRHPKLLATLCLSLAFANAGPLPPRFPLTPPDPVIRKPAQPHHFLESVGRCAAILGANLLRATVDGSPSSPTVETNTSDIHITLHIPTTSHVQCAIDAGEPAHSPPLLPNPRAGDRAP